MAGNSKEQDLALRVYNNLQRMGCPLVDGLYLREADSMRDLLCKPSQHRLEILKWICVSICPALEEKFSAMKPSDTEEKVKEITRFGHEMMLCKTNDQELIKGFGTSLRQLVFFEELLMIAMDSHSPQVNEDFLGVLMSPDNLPDLIQLMNPVCNPWSPHIQERLTVLESTQSKESHREAKQSKNRSLHHSGLGRLDDDLREATALLMSTRNALGELHKECAFLQSCPAGSGGSPSPCALKVAISDMAQLMSAFSQIYNTDFKDYCQRAPPSPNPSAQIFQRVHQLLHSCNMELEALKQLSETSSSLEKTVRLVQSDEQYWASGEKQTLSDQLEALRNRCAAFLSHRQSPNI